jgi:hypothetical protein
MVYTTCEDTPLGDLSSMPNMSRNHGKRKVFQRLFYCDSGAADSDH